MPAPRLSGYRDAIDGMAAGHLQTHQVLRRMRCRLSKRKTPRHGVAMAVAAQDRADDQIGPTQKRALTFLLVGGDFAAPFVDAGNQRFGAFAGDLWRVRVNGAGVAVKAEGITFSNDEISKPRLF